jgi:hypothetical protein
MGNDDANRLLKKVSGSEITGKISGAIAFLPGIIAGDPVNGPPNRNFSIGGSAA